MRKHKKGIVGILLSCALLAMTACGKEDAGEGSSGREGREPGAEQQEQSREQEKEPEKDPSGEGRTFCQRDDRGLGEITYGKLSTQGRWFAVNGMSGRAEYTFDSGYNITGLRLYYGSDDSVYRRMESTYDSEETGALLLSRDTYDETGALKWRLTTELGTTEDGRSIYAKLKGISYLFDGNSEDDRANTKYTADFDSNGYGRWQSWKDGHGFNNHDIWVLLYNEDGTLAFINVYNLVGSRYTYFVLNYEGDTPKTACQFIDQTVPVTLAVETDDQGRITKLIESQEVNEYRSRDAVHSVEITYTPQGVPERIVDTRANGRANEYTYTRNEDGSLAETRIVDTSNDEFRFEPDENGIAQRVYR